MSNASMRQPIIFLGSIIILAGCVPTKENPKYLFSDGTYNVRSGVHKGKSYLNVGETKIKIYKRQRSGSYDTTIYSTIMLTDTIHTASKKYNFTKSSFDFDLISIPLKFRPALPAFPAQLNATVNGGLFIGRRTDVYRLSWHKTELGIDKSALQHYGFSFGAFTGIGSAIMNPSVTNNQIETEYDAVVIPFGLTTLVVYNNLTFGIAAGVDHMLNNHRKYWIYDGKPWIGLAVGLNLN